MHTLRALLAAPLDPDRCEASSYPWWFILDPKMLTGRPMSARSAMNAIGCAAVTGPFFSRESATEFLNRTRYNFGPNTVVWCASGCYSEDYQKLLEMARVEGEMAKTLEHKPEVLESILSGLGSTSTALCPGCGMLLERGENGGLKRSIFDDVDADPGSKMAQAEPSDAIVLHPTLDGRPCLKCGGFTRVGKPGWFHAPGCQDNGKSMVQHLVDAGMREDIAKSIVLDTFTQIATPSLDGPEPEPKVYGKPPQEDAVRIMGAIQDRLALPKGATALDHGFGEPVSEAVKNAAAFDENIFVSGFKALQARAHENAKAKGWHEVERNEGELIALEHAELSECLEALRHGNPPSEHIPEFTGAEEELADVIIRIMDHAAAKGHRVAEAVIAKMGFNVTRPVMHGKLF